MTSSSAAHAHTTTQRPLISLACTVKNEADNIADLINSMLAQSQPADEIVINDCGSSDDTAGIVERYIADGHSIRLVRGGHNIPSGRNNAIRHTQGQIVACTDAGLTLDRDWLARITQPLLCGEADVVGGFFRPAPRSVFELAVAATNYRDAVEIDPHTFLPFGQSVAFRRTAWEHVGGYPEWASHCEDLLFDLALRRSGQRFTFVPDALVHFRPRESLAALARQYYSYARGDGVAGLWTRRHMARYLVYLAGLAIGLAAVRRPWLALFHLVGGLAYCRAPLQRLRRRAPKPGRSDTARAVLFVPVIRLVGDLAKMAGYPVGIVRRLRSPELRHAVHAYRNRWR